MVDLPLLEDLTTRTVETVAAHRAQWRESNVHAEALRVVRGRFTDPGQALRVAEAITRRAVAGEHSTPIGMDTEITATRPTELSRVDGESVYRVAKAQLYTSPAVLAAEARIVTAAGRTDGRRVRAADVELAELEWSANTGGRVLNTGQAAMVREIATSGRRVQLALAPAGTGKTTVMGVLAAAWRNGGGTVVGLAPQASAAQELGAAIPGVPADTLDKLVHDLTTLTPDKWQPWMTAIDSTSLVIVDEAGLASTPKLDTAIGFVLGRGGRVLLVGDDRQRAASGAGGVLRDIETTHGAVTLTEVLRFTDPTEGQASLALRAGDPSAVGFYADRSRVHAVTTDTAADARLPRLGHRHRRRGGFGDDRPDPGDGRRPQRPRPHRPHHRRGRGDRAGAGVAERGTGQRRRHRDHETEQADVVDGRHRLRECFGSGSPTVPAPLRDGVSRARSRSAVRS